MQEQAQRTKRRYTVSITQTVLSYTQATVEVEASDPDEAYALAQALDDAGKVAWSDDDGVRDSGDRDIEVTAPDGGTSAWREG